MAGNSCAVPRQRRASPYFWPNAGEGASSASRHSSLAKVQSLITYNLQRDQMRRRN